jgi:hypothetical protein
MIISVYLHDEIASVLKCYGTLNEVTNRILDSASNDEFDLMNKPTAPDRAGARRFDIDVVNQDYLDLMQQFPPNSSHISLRRLLYWFVEYEMFDELGWEPVNVYINKNEEKFNRLLVKMRAMLETMSRISHGETKDKILTMLDMAKELEK